MIGDMKKLRFWCQKVLPLSYDNSLSYYEFLCKVVTYLNHVIEDINSVPEYIDQAIDERLSDEHLIDLIETFITDYKHTISDNDDGKNTTASQSWSIGTWLWLDDVLYIVTKDITEGNAYVFSGENANVKPTTVEDENEIIYYANDKALSMHVKINDYSEIVTTGDVHVYNPLTRCIEIKKV